MDAWSYVSEAKGFGCGESISAQDMNGSMVLPSEKGIEIQGFEELGFPEMMRKPWDVINSFPGVSNSEVVSKRMYTPITSAMNAYSGDESSSKFSNSVVESNSRDSSLIDLNLGRFADHRDTQNLNSSKIAPILSSVESFTPAKRIRARLGSQAPFCQVHGCKKDLSSSKDYHKRHKVCEVHSKTAKVIVDGIEQRFCQQCSRFHLLGEFDDGKRSCRKRLAGHNERRRKPQAGTYSGRTGRLFHSYIGSTGSRLQGSMLTNSSFICQDILPTDLLPPLKYDTNDWSKHRKLEEDGANCHPESEITIKNGYFHPKSMSSHSFVKSIPPLHVNEVNSSSGGNLNDTTNQNFHEAFILFDSASSVQGLSGISASGRALSLLSSQSHNSSSHSMGILIPQASIHGLSNKFDPTGLISAMDNNFGPILSSDENGVVNYGDEIFHGSQYMNRKGRRSCDEGATIDLLQLSSQLQRVEHERESMAMKCGHKIT